MTDDEIIALAKSLGWNVEHAQTNRMLVLFARDIEDRTRSMERRRTAVGDAAVNRGGAGSGGG